MKGGIGRRGSADRSVKRMDISSERKDGEIEQIRDEDSEDGFPTKSREHVVHPPVPFARDHDDGRGGEVGERSADRDVHEKEAKGGIAQIHAWLELVESLHEEQGADGHCGRLGNE